MGRAIVVLAGLVVFGALGGCPGPGGQPDAGHDGGGGGGLVFELQPAPALPQISAKVTITELKVTLRDVRAIGDAAPGDSRTSLAELQMDFRQGDAPARIEFPLAPPGLYSRLDARIGPAGGGDAWEARGTVTVTGGATYQLELSDDTTPAFSVSLAGLRVEAMRTVTIDVSLAFLASYDWDSVPPSNGKIVIQSGDPRAAALTSALVSSFSVTSIR